jgi:hypothetical protein
MSHQGFENAQEAIDFIFAGKARVTLTSTSGVHFTFKIEQGKDEDAPFFVRVLTGSDNSWSGNWDFLGTIFSDGRSRLVGGRKGMPNAPSFKAFFWTLRHLAGGDIPEALTIQHNDSCGRCGKDLTDPISVAIGLGPVCAGR